MLHIRVKLNKLIICCSLVWLTGCTENKYIVTTDRICASAESKADAMAVAKKVLAQMSFSIEKFDVETGFIKTRPLSGAQSFEFWRCDSVGSFNQAEADLQTLRRTVELNLSDQAGQLCINCKAITERLSISHDQAASDQSRMIMSSAQRSARKIAGELKTNATWLNLGRDSQLETEIIKRIESRLAADKKRLAVTN
jgi:hypothetical protein